MYKIVIEYISQYMYHNIKYKWTGCFKEMDINIGKINLLLIIKQNFQQYSVNEKCFKWYKWKREK